jgi:rfaE bifunctional protein kinase chain/domain
MAFSTLELVKGKSALVIGDLMLDIYIYTCYSRKSPEYNINAYLVDRKDYYLGGAGNVAMNLASLGVYADLTGPIGDSVEANIFEELTRKYSQIFFPRNHLSTRYNEQGITTKTRIYQDGTPICRIDDDRFWSLPLDIIANSLFARKFDALLISDYQKGMFHGGNVNDIIREFRSKNPDAIVAANPKPKLIDQLEVPIDLVTMNQVEKSVITDNHSSTQEFMDAKKIKYLVVTNGAKGLTLHTLGGETITVLGKPVDNPNPVGAGDATFAAAAMAATTGDPIIIAKMANCAGASKCMFDGTKPLCPEVMDKLYAEQEVIE